MNRPAHSTLPRAVRIGVSAAALLFSTLWLSIALHSEDGRPAGRDLIAYWSAGQLLLHHANPYDPAATLRLEQAQGFTLAQPIMMRNLPWALWLVAPLGLLTAYQAALFWIALTLSCFVASVHLVKALHPGAPRRLHLLAYAFAPVAACIMACQTSALPLLGLTLFLWLHLRRPFLAGASLALLAIKPHLFLPFWLVLCADSLRRRRPRMLAGLALALTAAAAFAWCFDPQVWPHYAQMMRSERVDEEFLQTPSYLLRAVLDKSARWIQLVPSAAATVWAAFYYARHHRAWDWSTHGLLLVAVSLWVSPYGWVVDDVVLVPAMLHAFYTASPVRRRWSIPVYLALNAVILLLLVGKFALGSGAYLWTTTAWLALYLATTRRPRMARLAAPVPS